jgi:hypothetical protein
VAYRRQRDQDLYVHMCKTPTKERPKHTNKQTGNSFSNLGTLKPRPPAQANEVVRRQVLLKENRNPGPLIGVSWLLALQVFAVYAWFGGGDLYRNLLFLDSPPPHQSFFGLIWVIFTDDIVARYACTLTKCLTLALVAPTWMSSRTPQVRRTLDPLLFLFLLLLFFLFLSLLLLLLLSLFLLLFLLMMTTMMTMKSSTSLVHPLLTRRLALVAGDGPYRSIISRLPLRFARASLVRLF